MAQSREHLLPGNTPWVQFLPSATCGLSLLLVLALLRELNFSGFPGFLAATKSNISKFQFDQDRGPAWKPAKVDVASSLNIVIYLFIYFTFTMILCCIFSGTFGHAESSYWTTGKADNKLREDKNHSYKNIWACSQTMWVSGTTMGKGMASMSCFLYFSLLLPLPSPLNSRFWLTGLRLPNCCPQPIEVNWNKWRWW